MYNVRDSRTPRQKNNPRWVDIPLNQSIIRGVMVKAIDCGIVVREFVLQSRYYVHFLANTLGKSMNPLILPAMFKLLFMALALNNLKRVDMPLNKESPKNVSSHFVKILFTDNTIV